MHAVGPPQRRRARGVRGPGAEDRVGRPHQPHPAAPRRRLRHPARRLDRDVDRGRDPRERRGPAVHGHGVRPPPRPVHLPGALQGRQPALPHPPRRARRLPGGVLRPRARSPRAPRGRLPRRHHHREALHRRPRHGGQRPQGLAAPRRVRDDGPAHPRPRGGPRHGTAAGGVDRRDDEPGQPGQEPGGHPRPRPGRGDRPGGRRGQEPRPGPAAQRPRPPRGSPRQPAPVRGGLLLPHRPRRGRAQGPRLHLPPPLGCSGALPRLAPPRHRHPAGLPRVPLLLQGPRPRSRAVLP